MRMIDWKTEYTQYVIIDVQESAKEADSKPNDITIHANEYSVADLVYSEVIELIFIGLRYVQFW